MSTRDSGWVSGGVMDAEDARHATGVLAAYGAGPVRSRTGIKASAGFPGMVRASATPSGTVTVQPFQAVIQGTRGVNGPYLVTLDAEQSLNVLAVPADATKPRIDLIVAQQFDAQYNDAKTGFEVRHVAGTPDDAPRPPTIQGDYLELARITVKAGASSIIAGDIGDTRVFTAAAGGIIPVANRGSRPTAPYPGQTVYVRENNVTEVSDGTNWFPVARGGMATYGPADPGWPKAGTTSGETALHISRLTIPAVPFPRTLFVTAQAMVFTSAGEHRYDMYLHVGGVTRAIDVRTAPTTVSLNSMSTSGIVPQAANTALAIDLMLRRAAGNGTATVDYGPPYTTINALAIPS